MKVFDDGLQIELLKFLGVVERFAHGIGQRRVPVKNVNVQLVWPPVAIGARASVAHDWALAFLTHVVPPEGFHWTTH
jgi:hypothetical protein